MILNYWIRILEKVCMLDGVVELRAIARINMMWCNYECGIVKFHSEFVKDRLWIEYGIRSECDLDGWYVVIDRK